MTDPNEAPFASQVHQEPPTTPLSGLDQNTASGLRGKFIESILQLVVQALTGIFTPGPIGGAVTQLATWATDIGGTITGMLSGIVTGTVSTVGGLLGSFLNALLGFGSNVIPAYTPENAAIAGLQVQVNALAGAGLPGGSGIYDGFNTGPALNPTWDHICGAGNVVTAGGYAFSPTTFNCYRYADDRPGTTFWQVQASIAFNPGSGQGAIRIFGGADTTLTTRFPAIVFRPDVSSDVIELVSLAGTPSNAGLRDSGRIIHAQFFVGFFVIKTNDVLALECDETLGIYNVYLNPGPGSSPICTYDDSVANLIPRGVGHRDGGFQLNVGDSSGFPGPGLDNFGLFDRSI